MANSPALTRADFTVLRTVGTRWADNDVYGHINNAIYFEYLDTAVNGWLMEVTDSVIWRSGAVGLVASVGCDYYSEIAFPDVLSIGLATSRIGTSSITYVLGVFTQRSEELSALGRFVHVYVDSKTRTSVPIPQKVRRAVESLPRIQPPAAR